MDKSIIKKIILENQQRIPGLEIVKRDYSPEPLANYIFTGQRRAGKTWYLFSLIQEMIKQGTSIERVLYINFEDERLIGLDVNGFDMILESYQELFSHKPVLFFDEIQNVPGWQLFARRLADSNYRIYLTGSNSEMLSSEMASTLGGRFMVMEIGTLSFIEFLRFSNFTTNENIEFSPERFEIIRLFDQYFSEGGFPELTKFINKKEYLSSLFQKVFLGDIIARHQLRNPFAIRLLIKKLAESTMDEISFNRMRNIIISTGIQVGTATIIEYVKHLEDAYLIGSISNFDAKISSRETRKKYYFSDNGLLSLFLIEPQSFQLETLVYNTLRREYRERLFYLRNGFEVDFFIPGEALIQVCYGFSELATRQRELNALKKAYGNHPVNNLTIITYQHEEVILDDNLKIEVTPAWKWVLKYG